MTSTALYSPNRRRCAVTNHSGLDAPRTTSADDAHDCHPPAARNHIGRARRRPDRNPRCERWVGGQTRLLQGASRFFVLFPLLLTLGSTWCHAQDPAQQLVAKGPVQRDFDEAVRLRKEGRLPESIQAFDRLLVLVTRPQDRSLLLAERGHAWRLSAISRNLQTRNREIKPIEFRKAIADLDAAIEINPQCAKAYDQRAWAKSMAGNYEGASEDFTRALEINPQHGPVYVARSINWMYLEQPDRAVADADQAIKIAGKREPSPWRSRSIIRRALRDFRGAIDDLQKASELSPPNAVLLCELADLLSCSPDKEARDGAAAVKFAIRACELTSYKGVRELQTLAGAYAAANDFDLALKWQTRAVELSPDANRMAAEVRLELYRLREPLPEYGEISFRSTRRPNTYEAILSSRSSERDEAKPLQ